MADPLPEKKTIMLNRGTLTILGIVLLGASMASVAVWYHAQTGQRCLAVWGVDGARLIRHAPQVEALRLGPATDPAAPASADSPAPETLTLGEQSFAVVERVDISQTRGLLHARHALIMDHNFQFESAEASRRSPKDGGVVDAKTSPAWQYVLRFADGRDEALLAFDPQFDLVGLFPRATTLRLRSETMTAETALMEREFARPAK